MNYFPSNKNDIWGGDYEPVTGDFEKWNEEVLKTVTEEHDEMGHMPYSNITPVQSEYKTQTQQENPFPPNIRRQAADLDIPKASEHGDEIPEDKIVNKDGWTAPNRVWEALENKEDMEKASMEQQFQACQAKMYGDFLIYQEEMKQRRFRFIEKVGPQITVEQGYNIPFWAWWGCYLNRRYN
tara:strand:- start:6038 stop:6583 length:546 start_codon:yes stop_codon:yes gene_type:complete